MSNACWGTLRLSNASRAIVGTASPHRRYFQWKLTMDWFETYLKAREQCAKKCSKP